MACVAAIACTSSSPGPSPHDDALDAGDGATAPSADACPPLDMSESLPSVDCPNDLPSDMACATAAPTYDDVRPILGERCLLCHNASGVARAVRFDTYASIKTGMTRAHMLTQIYGCLMPPACAPALTTLERQTLLQWFVCGAPPAPDSGAD